uniref:Calmodulin-like protein 47 n=1 Tax=Carica papaya TaxID=3649 RepID=A0A3S8V2I9_CARPA|nr:calmodulin-like protein 47 [Carica papaya]
MEDNTSVYNSLTLVAVVCLLIIIDLVIILQDFSNHICYVLHIFPNFIFSSWNFWTQKNYATVAKNQLFVDRNSTVTETKRFTAEELRKTMERNFDVGADDVEVLFEEEEPSWTELREAFDVFDENKDGFIDGSELRKVLSVLGFREASEAECRKMIRAFDEDKDERIDFFEFVRIIFKSFS